MYPFAAKNEGEHAANMSNTARVDVFSVPGGQDEKFEEFWTHVVQIAAHTTLNPGDLLFIPAGWWHSMRAEDTSFSVSMWF